MGYISNVEGNLTLRLTEEPDFQFRMAIEALLGTGTEGASESWKENWRKATEIGIETVVNRQVEAVEDLYSSSDSEGIGYWVEQVDITRYHPNFYINLDFRNSGKAYDLESDLREFVQSLRERGWSAEGEITRESEDNGDRERFTVYPSGQISRNKAVMTWGEEEVVLPESVRW